jgi:hypothetical protein
VAQPDAPDCDRVPGPTDPHARRVPVSSEAPAGDCGSPDTHLRRPARGSGPSAWRTSGQKWH